MKPDINWLAALVFYLIFIARLVAFIIAPVFKKHSWIHSLVYLAFFVLISYATYDLTNLATTKIWPLLITVFDLIWGAVLSASVSILIWFIANKII